MFSSLTSDFTKLVEETNAEITELKNTVETTNQRLVTLEDRIEENDIYERRDILVFSGTKLPVQQPDENTSDIVEKLLKDYLNVFEFKHF